MQGCGTDQANITLSVMEEFVSVESIEAVLMDITPVITGFTGGLHVRLDKKLGMKLHYTSQVASHTMFGTHQTSFAYMHT
jgi:hypothetical protein